MLVLLDENLPQRLRHILVGHDVRTVGYQNWAGLTNGVLLRTAEAAGFQVFVTADQGIYYQQNRIDSVLRLIVLSSNERTVVTAQAPKILSAIEASQPGSFTFVNLEH